MYLYVELPKFWAGLCRTLGLEAWLDDPRLQTMRGRHAHKAELIAAITDRLAARPAGEWETVFETADVPCTRLRSVPDVLADPQALAIGTLATVHIRRWGRSASSASRCGWPPRRGRPPAPRPRWGSTPTPSWPGPAYRRRRSRASGGTASSDDGARSRRRGIPARSGPAVAVQ